MRRMPRRSTKYILREPKPGRCEPAGPGILFASAAVGTSHLIQSTRAGAEFGLIVLALVAAVLVLRYPFFEYGLRYASATGTSLVDGYRRLGRASFWLFFATTLAAMLFVTGAVMFVTAGFFANLFQIGHSQELVTVVLFAVCVSILVIGRYSALDWVIKAVAIIMVVATAAAFLVSVWNGPVEPMEGFAPRNLLDDAGIFFLLALLGFMPAPIDASTWTSLWSLERIKQSGYRPRLKESISEFKFGYVVTGLLATMFVVLGTNLFFGSGEALSDDGAGFAHQVVTLYTSTIGQWSYPVVAASAFTVMFGTVMTVLDGYTRSLKRAADLMVPGTVAARFRGNLMNSTILVALAVGSLVVILQFGSSLRELVDFATVLSFVVFPVMAYFNLRLMGSKYIAKESQPSASIRILSYAGMIFLVGLTAIFLFFRFT